MAKSIVDFRHIYAGYNSSLVLEDVNLQVEERDFLAIIGPNGGGKTTLLKVMLGLLAPISGEVVFHLPRNKRGGYPVGYLPQFSQLDKQFPVTVMDVVLSGLASEKRIWQRYTGRDRKRVETLLEEMGIGHLRDSVLGELSGGQMQRAFLSRALVAEPELLVLDEPNAFVDQSFAANFYNILYELNKKMAIMLVSHDVGMISSSVKNIACVNRSLHYHPSHKIDEAILEGYGCPVEILAHGRVPHRVVSEHAAGDAQHE